MTLIAVTVACSQPPDASVESVLDQPLAGCSAIADDDRDKVDAIAKDFLLKTAGVELEVVRFSSRSLCGEEFVIFIEARRPQDQLPRAWMVRLNADNPEQGASLGRPE